MKNAVLVILVALAAAIAAQAQAPPQRIAPAAPQSSNEEKPKRQIFRANKGQIIEAQTMLKGRKLYSGEATGKLDDATRDALRSYQKESGLRVTGTLNRLTLEKMGIELTDAQKAIPVTAGPPAESRETGESATKRYIFRANKLQITAAQKLLKSRGMYSGDATGKLDDATRAGLRQYQQANDLKVTGTLNRVTLEKMGIELTDKQKEAAARK